MLLQSRGIILHTEFQTIGDETMPFRMADYYLRLQRKFPETDIQQVVVYLKRTSSDLVRQTRYVTSVIDFLHESSRMCQFVIQQTSNQI